MKDAKKQYLEYLDSEEGIWKYNEFKKILYGKDDSLIPKLFRIVYPKVKNKKELDVLDVGGGDGRRLKHLMDLFKKKGIDSKAHLVEPSKAFISECKKKTDQKKHSLRIEKKTFEKFSTKDKYDVIFLIHSIYTFKNRSYLDKIKKMLKEDGLAIFVTNGDGSFLAGLKKIMDKRYSAPRNEVTSLMKELTKNKCEVKKFDTKFSGVLSRNEFNQKGKLIMEWIGLDDFSKISLETKEMARKYFVRKNKKGFLCDKEVVVMTKFELK